MTGNRAQIDYWNGPAGEKWARHNSETDRNLAEAADAALRLAAAKPGERVLDVGCGAGAASMMLAGAVGPSGFVRGVDVSKPLLAMAERRAHAANVAFLQADAASCSFSPEHDLIFSCFGVMFFVDPVAAFANIRKSAAEGARLAFVCWRGIEENEWVLLPWAAAKTVLPAQKPVHPHAPGPFAFADSSRVGAILAEAGFSHIRFEKFDGLMDLGRSPDKASFQVTQLMGPTARALRNADAATEARVAEAVRGALEAHLARTGHIRLGIACWLVSARAD